VVSRVMFSSKTDQHSTPLDFFMELDAEFGFDVDVCALESNAKCNVYFGPDHWDPAHRDGLERPWSTYGRADKAHAAVCWMNPPYGRTIGLWMQKALDESRKGATVVCLVPERTDTRWWHETVIAGGAEVRFVRGRLKFGSAKHAAPFPSAVVIFRPPESA
jgi:phage N-6-adenine-methyltransferase